MHLWGWDAVLGVDPTAYTVVGLAGALVTLGGYLLTQLSRASGGAWKVVQDKNRTIHRDSWEKAVYQRRIAVLERDLRVCRGLTDATTEPDVPDPGPYVPPTKEELTVW